MNEFCFVFRSKCRGDSIPLDQRIQYLARAVMCMRSESTGYSAHNGELLRELEDKLEIAQVQKQVLDSLTNNQCGNVEDTRVREAIQKLNLTLYNMTQLYGEFADEFGLWECKLTILNISHHNDPLLVESVLNQILDKMLEGNDSVIEKSKRLLAKVQSLASEFGNSGPCFPLGNFFHSFTRKLEEIIINRIPSLFSIKI